MYLAVHPSIVGHPYSLIRHFFLLKKYGMNIQWTYLDLII